MKDKILKIVIDSIDEINSSLEERVPVEAGVDCFLYGASGVLDSISLVTLVVSIEDAIEDEFNLSILLANDKAMSQRNSPFLTIQSLVNYVEQLINDELEKNKQVCHE